MTTPDRSTPWGPPHPVDNQTLVIDATGKHAFVLEGLVMLPVGAVIGIPDGPDAEVVKVSLTRPIEDVPARLMLHVQVLKKTPTE